MRVRDKIMQLNQLKIFDEFGDDSVESRQLIGGNSTGIMNLNSVRYSWAPKLFKIMTNNFWLPEKVSLVDTRNGLKLLTPDERVSFEDTLSFLIVLDSMQVSVLPNIGDYITAPEVKGLFTVQAYQELIHSQSYQYILQELFNSTEREAIYNRWRTNPLLLKRNKTIAEKYQKFVDNPSLENYKVALAADFALEGIYFYNGFQFFYQLAARNKVPEVSEIIRYIQTDEQTHLSLMIYLIREVFDLDNFEDRMILIDTIMEATEQEIEWAINTYGNRILGISEESSASYPKYLANQRAKAVGLGVLYKGYSTDPYAYLEEKRKGNFFERGVIEYSQHTAVTGWDDF